MSTVSPQAAAAGETQLWQAQLAQQFSGVARPELQNLVSRLGGLLSTPTQSGQLAPDAAIKAAATDQINQGYGQAQFGSREAIGYGGLRSGEGRLSSLVPQSGVMSAATTMEQQRQAALRNLEFQSAQTSMQDYNQVLGLLGQGVQTSLGLAGGFSGAATSAIGGMSNANQAGSILGGAASGAAAGATLGPYGALAGGVIGGVLGGVTSP